MIKNLIIYLLLSITLLYGTVIDDKVRNIIGDKEYNLHQKLISYLFSKEDKFLVNNRIKYYNLFKTLRENGLLNLKLNKPSDIVLEFKCLAKNKKAFKILNDMMKAIGYRYFFTKSFQINDNNELFWTVKFKAEYMTDPVVLIKELRDKNCKILIVENKNRNHWYYEIDFSDSILNEAYKIEKNEKVTFQKPLQEYFISVDEAESLQIISRKLNSWYPYISFFDNNLNLLSLIKKDRIYKGIKTKIPKETKYIKIADTFNLINIKRGLTIIVR